MAKITMREAISQALMEEMDRDPAVFIMGEEVGVWGGTYAVTKGFYDKYGPDRIKDTPIAENAIIGAAIGAAMVGQRPIAELMTINFAFSAMDYIVNQAPKLHYMFGGQFTVPMVIRAVGGAGLTALPDWARYPSFAPAAPHETLASLKRGLALLNRGGRGRALYGLTQSSPVSGSAGTKSASSVPSGSWKTRVDPSAVWVIGVCSTSMRVNRSSQASSTPRLSTARVRRPRPHRRLSKRPLKLSRCWTSSITGPPGSRNTVWFGRPRLSGRCGCSPRTER